MKRLPVVLVVVAALASGCGPSAFVLRGASLTAAADLSRCAQRQLVRLGYEVRDGSPESGVITAVRNTSSTRMVLLSGNDSEERLIVATASGGPAGKNALRVTGESYFWGADARRIAAAPSARLDRDARQILEACGILDAERGY